ncbi:MAG TPA: PQQ-dependent sugar dehydrogenase [Luteimonas sp.]|jgi:glucose/arabinose dehydrogenase|nr:PQQ-dependent sugar dehydrogenase [Luteimonas sp.]
MRIALTSLLLCLALPACRAQAPAASREETGSQGTRIATIASGLEHPWAVAPLPDGRFLVTERPGRMRYVSATGALSAPLGGVPAVWANGQAGLLDVALAPDFARSRRIWITWVAPADGGAGAVTAAYATLGEQALSDLHVVYREPDPMAGGANFGSRLAFDGHGHVFVSQGDRFDRQRPQQLDYVQGKLLRLNVDGTMPADNPFAASPGVRRIVWSYGHRNVQGLAFDPRTGKLWASEHGPRGGDELNLPQPGKNYGWPVATNGMDYSTNQPYPETVGTRAPGMESPYRVWAKSPGLSGMAFYTGHPGSAWNDSLFLGALADRNLIRLSLDGDRITGEERLLQDLGARIRDVRVGANGDVYVLTDEADGRLLRLRPPSR